MSIIDVLKQRLAERPNNNWRLANMVGQQRPDALAARSGIPGVNDVIRPGDPGYPTQEMTHQTAPPPPGVPPQYARPVYDKEYSSYNRLEELRNAGAGYGNGRFYAQGEIYNYDPASQGYRGSISGSVIQQPQGARPPEYQGYNSSVVPAAPAPATPQKATRYIDTRSPGQYGGQARSDDMTK